MASERKNIRIFRPNDGSSPYLDDDNYKTMIALMKAAIRRKKDKRSIAGNIEFWSGVVARDHGKSIVIVDRDLDLPDDLAAHLRALRKATRSPDWHAITALMIAYPQHIDYDARSPDRVNFDSKAAGASELIQHMLRRHHKYASDLAAEVLHDADPARNQKRLNALGAFRRSR